MSALTPKADIIRYGLKGPLIAKSGHLYLKYSAIYSSFSPAASSDGAATCSPQASKEGEQLEYVKCRGRHEAVKAARKLRKKYADDYDAEFAVDVEIAPAGADFAPE